MANKRTIPPRQWTGNLRHELGLLQDLLSKGPGDKGFPGHRRRQRLLSLHLLAQGLTHQQAAQRLGLTDKAVAHQGRKLARQGALQRRTLYPVTYEPGGNFATVVGAHGSNHGEWSKLTAGDGVARLHNVQAKVPVLDRDTGLPPPLLEREWGPSGHRHRTFRVTTGAGISCKIRESHGPNLWTLLLYLPSAVRATRLGLGRASTDYAALVEELLAVLAGRHGYRFGTWAWTGAAEAAFPAPSLHRLAGFRSKAGWVDCSQGPAEVEAGYAAAVRAIGNEGALTLLDDIVRLC